MNRYQQLILLLIGCFLAFSVWATWQASTKGSRVTDADYYSKGLRYNQTRLEKNAARTLGWQVTSTLTGRQLTIALDSGRKPVSAADGVLLIFPNDGSAVQQYRLAEERSGRYILQLPATLHGECRVLIEFEHQGARLERQLLLNLPEA
ncbi:MAG: FixH family protein [Desulfuromonadales bacterium]|nr:FixH family protein [Desulfuromonadales bacterium]MDT8422952.1 FixH family protein [Desulfuromonadales bacterium]